MTGTSIAYSRVSNLFFGTRVLSLFHLLVRLLPAMALFALLLTDDPVLRWLSVLGVAPLAFALLPGVPGDCAACQTDTVHRTVLPPAH